MHGQSCAISLCIKKVKFWFHVDFNLEISTHESSITPVTRSQVSLKSVDVPCIVPGYPRDGIFSRGRPSFPCTASVTGLHCTAAPAGSLSPRPGWWGKASECLETWNRGPSHQHLTKSLVVSALLEIFLCVKATNQNNNSDPYYYDSLWRLKLI